MAIRNELVEFAAATVAAAVKAQRLFGFDNRLSLALPDGWDRETFIPRLTEVLGGRDTIEDYWAARTEAREREEALWYGPTTVPTSFMAKIEAEGLGVLSDHELVTVSHLTRPQLWEAGYCLAVWKRRQLSQQRAV